MSTIANIPEQQERTPDLERAIMLYPSIFGREYCWDSAQNYRFKPDKWQVEALDSDEKRMIFNCSRQSGKTEVAAILADHTAQFEPRSLTLIIAPSQRQSYELFQRCKAHNDEYDSGGNPDMSWEDMSGEDRRFGGNALFEVTEMTKLHMKLANGSRVICIPAAEGTIRGYAAPRLIIIDEASKVPDAVWTSLYPMASAYPKCRILLMSTPAGKRGFFYDRWHEKNNWKKFRITADECSRITPETLAEARQMLDDELFRQEYFGHFIDIEGGLFSDEDIAAAFSPSSAKLLELDDYQDRSVITWEELFGETPKSIS